MRSDDAPWLAGVRHGLVLVKVAVAADVGELVYGALAAELTPGLEPGPGDDLDTLLPEPGALERALIFLEDRFQVRLGDRVMTRLMAEGTVGDLVAALTRRVTGAGERTTKTADYDRRAYMANRERHKARARVYRMANAMKLRRRAKIYRRRVAHGAMRPRRRVGSAGAGYQFLLR